ncbi:MAG: hypothetical protein ACR2NU_09425 [Aeoliella sp.]
MAGKLSQNRSAHERLMLTALVAVVWWAALEAWRPWNSHRVTQTATRETAERYSAARLTARETFSATPDIPCNCRMAFRKWRGIEAPVVAIPLQADEALLRGVPWAPQTISVRHETDTPVVVTWANPSTAPPRVEQRPKTASLRFPSVTLPTGPWRLAGFDTAEWWWEAGHTLARLGCRNRMPSQNDLPQRISSPPSLVRLPMVTDEDDRLALIPSSRPPKLSLPKTAHDWQGGAFDAVRPFCAESLGRCLQKSIFTEPSSLIEQLQELSHEPDCTLWAADSMRVLETLLAEDNSVCLSFSDRLAQLAHMSSVAEELATVQDSLQGDPGLATRLRRARYAMWRRVVCWRAAYSLIAPPVDRLTLAAAGIDSGDQPMASLATQHQEPVRIAELLALVERYEAGGRVDDAHQLADQIVRLAASPDARRRALAESMAIHYRNANARLALSSEMIERCLPEDAPRTEPVQDRVLGTPVRGHATTFTRKRIALVPDPQAWRLALLLEGRAASQTIAFERTVRVRTAGTTRFQASQQLLVDQYGLRHGPAIATATTDSQFVGAASKYDPLPLVGEFVRSRAADAFSERRSRAENEVATKTARRVENSMGQAVARALSKAEADYRARVTEPLASGGVVLEPIEMRTTNQRLIARLRIDHDNGLTAHTPRPRAPSDSLASLQLHESGLTNMAAGLELAGARLTPLELADRFDKLSQRAARPEWTDDAKTASIQFADHNPVTLKLTDGQAQLTLAVRELVVRNRPHRNFKVHVYYKPEADGLRAQFAHAEGPYFEGKMRNAERMRLQTIFGKVFPPRGDFVIGSNYADDPRLTGIMITQLIIDDGWLALALGPERQQRTAQLDRYAPLR